MGGTGSTRWNGHSKKTQVESCLALSISMLKPYLIAGFYGKLRWSMNGEDIGRLSFRAIGSNKLVTIQLMYFVKGIETKDYICLTTTQIRVGIPRYWFICPLTKDGHICDRRVGVLYLPPGGRYFGCRHCYDLTYRSNQEKHHRHVDWDYSVSLILLMFA